METTDNIVFTIDDNVIIKLILPNEQISKIFKDRDNHEVMFRRIHTYLIKNSYI